MEIDFIQNAIEKAFLGISKLNNEILQIEGWSSVKIRHLLNNLCSYKDINYLEIGLFLGSTFVSALYNNDFKFAIGIDCQINEQFYKTKNIFLSKYKNIELIESDCFSIDLEKFKNKIDIYFYDGNHSQEDQENAFEFYDKILNNKFIAIVDDWNDSPTKIGTKNIFKKLNYNIIYEKELFSDGNCDNNSWWNGIYVGLIEKKTTDIL